MPWRSLGASFTNSVILGLAVFVGFVAKPGEAWLAVLALGMMGLLCAVAMIIDGGMQLERLNSERFQLRSTLPIAALGLLPMPFVDWPWRFVFCALLLLGFLPQAMTNINAVAESMRFYRLSPMRAYPSSRQVNVIGFAAGHAMGFFIFGDFLQDSVQGMVITLLMLITLLIILSAFLFKDGYPPVDLEAAETSLAAPDKTEAPGRYKWRLKTEAYAKIIGLTSRQSEILMLLARGYSTKSIEERLYISEHTAKSHIYNIYQKAGVHTRQEIIKLIEQVELAPEDALAGMPQADARPSDSATP
jgi:DNA-binding CsgD family transcriptional regulator